MSIKQACFVIADLEDGTTALSVTFDGGFDKTSPAHCSLRKVLEILDNMGMAIIEPMEMVEDSKDHIGVDFGKDGPLASVPTPMLVDGNGHTIISH